MSQCQPIPSITFSLSPFIPLPCTLQSFEILPHPPALQKPLFPLPYQPSSIYTCPLSFIPCQITYYDSAFMFETFYLPVITSSLPFGLLLSSLIPH